ncbi:hypothetical protein [uncultured Shimia sp.]|uniref:hypothetical protein n=1 Tax=uncultured Shimia sp. TaxID=573152 RepID=UPI00263030CE|nr:hypothetical protein [uncultured Shimia sp.]
MRLIPALALALLTPLSAQAVVLVQYEEIELKCQSDERCNTQGDCVADTSLKTVISLGQDTYMGSFSPFAQRREKWARALTYDGFDSARAPQQSTYRTLSKAKDAASTYRKASSDERQSGWFGPELPDLNQPQSGNTSSFRLFHTRSVDLVKKGLFQNKDRQIISFECRKVGR